MLARDPQVGSARIVILNGPPSAVSHFRLSERGCDPGRRAREHTFLELTVCVSMGVE